MKKLLTTVITLFLVISFNSNAWAELKLDIGGQMRFRPESRNNSDFSDGTKDENGFYGQRIRLNFDIETSENISGFLQIQDARRWGSASNVGTAVNESSDHENLDIYQAFLKIDKIFNSHAGIKIGRQTLVYGDQRLFGNLGWKDEARSFDAIKLFCKSEKHNLDLFFSRLKENPGTSFDGDQDLFGLYSTFKQIENNTIDLYYFLWADGVNNRRINTFGTRFNGKISSIDYSAEAVKQLGVWDTVTKYQYHQAYAFSVKAGYTLPIKNTRFGIGYDRGSGGEVNTGEHKDFVFPFHTNHAHYGYMDYFSWGNMSDLSFSIKSKLNKKVTVKADYHLFKLVEEKGNWLNVVGTGVTSGMSGASAFKEDDAGSELDLTLKYLYNKNLNLTLGYSLFFAGDAVKERKGDNDLSRWAYLMLVYNF